MCFTHALYTVKELEQAFMEAKSQVESGAVDCGDSDEEQTREVSSPVWEGGIWYWFL